MAKDAGKRRRKSGRRAAMPKNPREFGKLLELLRRRRRQYQNALGLFNATRATVVAREWQSAKALAVIAEQLEDILHGDRDPGKLTAVQLQMLAGAQARASSIAARIGELLTAQGANGQNNPPPLPAGIVPPFGVDPAELAVIIILMMVQDSDQDLNEKMAEAEAQMQAKQALRALLDQFLQDMAALLSMVESAAPGNIAQIIGSAISILQNDLDSDNEISEMTSMQLQMLMDARSKLLQTASDIEKSLSDTEMAIVGNIKQ